MLRRAALAALITAAVLGVYAQVRHHGFVDVDDHRYIVENPILRLGLTTEGVRRIFTEPYLANWIPLTSLSLQLDYALYGLEPAGYLLTNVALHALASVLLFLALARATGAVGRSAFVAAVFALHPLHVESVAWASSRKDVLSGVFFALTLLAYAAYADRRTPVRLALVALALAAGLLSKPTLVTLPFALLLLDYWPLGRLRPEPPARLPEAAALRPCVVEKLPLFALVAVASGVTFATQSAAGAVFPSEQLPLGARLATALHAYAAYLGDSFWPSGLAFFYPRPAGGFPAWDVALGAAVVAGGTALALWQAASRPYATVGWLWFLGTLVPVIGIVQVGMQARADRYMYLPLVGIAIAVAWGAHDAVAGLRGGLSRARRHALAALAVGVLAALAAITWRQVGTWRDPLALNERALAVTEDNFVAHYGFATALANAGRQDEAREHFQAAIRIQPAWSRPRIGLGDALAMQGRWDAAAAAYERGLRLEPEHARGLGNLGQALLRLGRYEEARARFERALGLRAADPLVRRATAKPHFGLADTLVHLGELERAIRQYQLGLDLEPDRVDAHESIAILAPRIGRLDLAVRHLRELLRLDPERPMDANNLAWILATAEDAELRDPAEAIRIAERNAARFGEPPPALLDTLAAAYAAAGRFDDAVDTAERAREIASAHGQGDLAAEIGAHADLYRTGRPYIERRSF